MFTYARPARMIAKIESNAPAGAEEPIVAVPVNPLPVAGGAKFTGTLPADESAARRWIWPNVMLSIGESIMTSQLTTLSLRTVTTAWPVAVVVTGVGASFAPLSVAV